MAKKSKKNIDELVVKAKDGDAQAFADIYDELITPVYRYIYYRVDNAIAEDLTEDTFLKVWQNLKKYKKKRKNPFSSWVFRIAHNLIVDYYRKNRVIEEINDNIVDTDKDNSPEEKTHTKLTNIRLRKVIRRLPDNYQEIIILKYINELDNKEISAAIGKSESTIRTIQFRALEKLRSMLGEEKGFF